MKKYEIIREIGDGTYGIVYEGKNKETNQKVAIKTLKQKYRTLEECLSKIEVKVLEKLNNENIVQLKEVIKDKKGEVSYIFEYCDCNLFEFIENHREHKKIIPEPIIREITFQIVKGMKYMHSQKYFHRDLKPENILVILNNYNLNNTACNEIKIKIADFGTAKEIPNNNNNNNILPMSDYVCTRWYRAPECVFRGDIYDEKVDVWAIGCIMAELYNLSAIFQGENEFDQLNQILKILGTPTRSKWPWGYFQADLFGIQLPVYYKKDFKKILGYISQEGVNFLNDVFTFDSTKRPSCSKLLNHPYFKMMSKPKIMVGNSLRISARKNNNTNNLTENYNINSIINNNIYICSIFNSNNKDNKGQNKNNLVNNKDNNNNKNKTNLFENKINHFNKSNINKAKKIKNNNYVIKRNIKTKTSDNNLNINEYKSNINTNINKNNYINIKQEIINNLSTTDKKKNIGKYVKLNEIKSGLVTKKIIQYTKNKEVKKKDNKKELFSQTTERIGRNEANYLTVNNSKKFSFAKNYKELERDDSRNKSIESLTLRNTLSTNKNIITSYDESKQNNDLKKFDNNKILDIVYINNSINNNHNININNNSVLIIKKIKNKNHNNNKINNVINYNKPQYSGRNIMKKTNTKVIYSGKNKEINSENNKTKYQNNHKFYVSNGDKFNKNYHTDRFNNKNYKRFINRDNYNTYNEIESYNHQCICSIGRNYSAKKNFLYNHNSRVIVDKMKNVKHLENYYRNINTPRNYSNIKKNYTTTNNITISPLKKKDKINSLFSSFVNNKNNNGKYLITKSQCYIKSNISTINLNPQLNFKNCIDKNKIKLINLEDNNKRKCNISNSTSKKRKL